VGRNLIFRDTLPPNMQVFCLAYSRCHFGRKLLLVKQKGYDITQAFNLTIEKILSLFTEIPTAIVPGLAACNCSRVSLNSTQDYPEEGRKRKCLLCVPLIQIRILHCMVVQMLFFIRNQRNFLNFPTFGSYNKCPSYSLFMLSFCTRFHFFPSID
jgi:hypothetical protein